MCRELGWMCREAYGTVCDVYVAEPDAANGVAVMIVDVESLADVLRFNPRAHSVVPEGVFVDTARSILLPAAQGHRAE